MAKRILIVEDTKSLADGIGELLQMEGFTVAIAYNGVQALDLLASFSADLILTDLVMPAMDGLELIRHLRSKREYAHIPIILLTAQTGEENKVAGIAAGANLFLEKPFEDEGLLDSVSRLLSS